MSLFGQVMGVVALGAAVGEAAWNAARDVARTRFEAAGGRGSLTADARTLPAPWQERDPAILGNRLTPTVLASIIRRRNEGHFQPWVDLGAEFLGGRNPHLLTQLGVRDASVCETRFRVRPGAGKNPPGARRAAADFEALLGRWKRRKTLRVTQTQVVRAEWWGRSLHELLWSDESGVMAPERAAWVHPRRLSYACDRDDPEPWVIRLHDPDDPRSPFYGSGLYGVPISRWHPDKFILQECTPLGLHATGEGLFAGVVWYLLMYEWSWRDLMQLVELLGRPGHVGYYAAGGAKASSPVAGMAKFDGGRAATPEEIEQLHKTLLGVGGSLRAVLSDTTRVEPLKYDNRTTPLQLEVAKHIEGLLSKALTGTTGVTDIVAGARAAHDVAWRQSLTYWRYDCERWIGWLMDLAERMVRANPGRYGVGTPGPEVWSPDLEPAEPADEDDPKAGDRPAKEAA